MVINKAEVKRMNKVIESNQMQVYDVERIRGDFPILRQCIRDKALVYLDNSATTQKPTAVIDAISHYYIYLNSNIHRGVHTLSEQATQAYENARKAVQNFINAKYSQEIIFLRGTTEALNLLAQTFGRSQLKKDDEIIISALEHHSNIVPWQELCQQLGIQLRIVPISDQGELSLEAYEKLFNSKTKLVSIAHVSNAVGTINPIKKMIAIAHRNHVTTIIDGAQAVPHMPVDMQDLDCDFYVFSGHKMYGPTGIGVLYGKKHLLESLPPYQFGGGMIRQVNFTKTTYAPLPEKFEAGTPNIEAAIGLHAAINYLNTIGMKAVQNYENELLNYALQALKSIIDVEIVGQAADRAAVISFVMQDIHPHDIGTILDNEGIAVRAGHHCAMPLMECLGVPATLRVSMGIYNTHHDIDKLIDGLEKVRRIFQ
jgi:cysteine desulfurase/selenocysteine lyase